MAGGSIGLYKQPAQVLDSELPSASFRSGPRCPSMKQLTSCQGLLFWAVGYTCPSTAYQNKSGTLPSYGPLDTPRLLGGLDSGPPRQTSP